MLVRRVLIVFDGFQCLYLSERSGNYVFHVSNMRNCIAVCLGPAPEPVLQSMVFSDWKCFDLIDAQAGQATQASTVSFEMHLLYGRHSHTDSLHRGLSGPESKANIEIKKHKAPAVTYFVQ